MDNNAILAFDELDRQCANYFLAKKVAAKGQREIDRLLFQTDKHRDTSICRLISEGWHLLQEAQAALAHTCVLMYTVKSAKVTFLYEHQKMVTQTLQQKFEEVWVQLDSFPFHEAKMAIQDLRQRLRDYLVSVQSEILNPESQQQQVQAHRSGLSSPIYGLGGSSDPSTTGRALGLRQESRKSPARHNNNRNHNNDRGQRQSSSTEPLHDASLSPTSSFNQQHSSSNSDYYDLVDRISTFSLTEKSALASAVFGDEFGGSGHIYRPL